MGASSANAAMITPERRKRPLLLLLDDAPAPASACSAVHTHRKTEEERWRMNDAEGESAADGRTLGGARRMVALHPRAERFDRALLVTAATQAGAPAKCQP